MNTCRSVDPKRVKNGFGIDGRPSASRVGRLLKIKTPTDVGVAKARQDIT
jgi:hypothetical protein